MSFFNKKIFDYESDIIGLDLSDFYARVVKIEDFGSYKNIVSYATCPIPAGCIINGEIQKKDQVISVIRKVISVAGPKKIKTNKVACSLPESKAFLRIISLPHMSDSEIEEAIKWEMEANIPLSLDQVFYDWQIIPKSVLSEKNKINLIVAAVPKVVVNQIVEILELAGVDPIKLEIESIAQARSLLNDKDEESTVMIIDIGAHRTSFSIVMKGLPCFTSSIPICGRTLTDAIAKDFKTTFEEAEKIKINYGIGYDKKETIKDEAIFKAQEPVLKNLVQEIERSINFYLTELKYSKSIDNIMLCGGGANTKGILTYLSEKLGRKIELGNPWVNVKVDKNTKVIKEDQSLRYSTAIGLVLK